MTAKTTKQDKVTDSATTAAETMVAVGQEALRNFAKASTESYENAFTGIRGKAGDLVQGYDEIAATGKENMEILSAAGTAYGKGVEAIGGEWMNFAKKMMDTNVQATKAILGAKSLNEVMDLQSEFMRGSFDGLMAQSTKIGELATKVAQDAAEPINAQLTATVEKWHKNAA
ncbi:MAG: phasin family protein [Alphaproteobacteria bacterium]|nr:phasin family protein [Alphaproteobacteria bacterium]